MNEFNNVCTWCPAIVLYFIQGIFLPQDQHFQDRLWNKLSAGGGKTGQTFCRNDQDWSNIRWKKDGWSNFLEQLLKHSVRMWSFRKYFGWVGRIEKPSEWLIRVWGRSWDWEQIYWTELYSLLPHHLKHQHL